MKMKLPYGISSLFLILISFTLFSCGVAGTFHSDKLASRDKGNNSFVEMTDGKVMLANEAVLRTSFFGKETIVLDGNTRVPVKEIVAYQNREAYYRKIDGRFAPRIKKGLINLYEIAGTYHNYNGPVSPGSAGYGTGGWTTNTKYVYYLQKGDSAKIELLSPDLIEEYVRDYGPALESVNQYYETRRKVKMWSVINTAATFGGLALTFTGAQSNTKLTTVNYTGIGLFLGGIANGFVNKVRKTRNHRNLDLAIEEYNNQVKRRKRK